MEEAEAIHRGEMQGLFGWGWRVGWVGHVEKRREGGTYGSAIRRQAESDRGGAAQVSANIRGGWRRRQRKLNKAFPGAAHIFP